MVTRSQLGEEGAAGGAFDEGVGGKLRATDRLTAPPTPKVGSV